MKEEMAKNALSRGSDRTRCVLLGIVILATLGGVCGPADYALGAQKAADNQNQTDPGPTLKRSDSTPTDKDSTEAAR